MNLDWSENVDDEPERGHPVHHNAARQVSPFAWLLLGVLAQSVTFRLCVIVFLSCNWCSGDDAGLFADRTGTVWEWRGRSAVLRLLLFGSIPLALVVDDHNVAVPGIAQLRTRRISSTTTLASVSSLALRAIRPLSQPCVGWQSLASGSRLWCRCRRRTRFQARESQLSIQDPAASSQQWCVPSTWLRLETQSS